MASKIRHGKRDGDSNPDRITNGSQNYQLGSEIGKGGFAVVFQAINSEAGDFYAIKRFPLQAIDNESLSSIEAEIELMKKLNHPNIVKYVDTIRTEKYLYIILEFMENGSLQNVIKKFGAFSESLAAIYIVQVLRGLKYLHEQGVLHRDIKGANILTNKEGLVKLADFGVAMKLSDAGSTDDHDVVGTPYWMAPEVIEMSTPTSACDIWSVGCTVIELLTCSPPYFDLSPMAALFRIVQDDYPPFPEGISPALRDFLLMCFQKEPIMRMSADKLLDHPWIKNSSTHFNKINDIMPRAATSLAAKGKHDEFEDEEAQSIVNTITLFQKGARIDKLIVPASADRGGAVSDSTIEHKSSKFTEVAAASTHATTTNVSDGRAKIDLSKWEDDEEDSPLQAVKGKTESSLKQIKPTSTSLPQSRNVPKKTSTAIAEDEVWLDNLDDESRKSPVLQLKSSRIHQNSMADIEDFLMSGGERYDQSMNKDMTWKKSSSGSSGNKSSSTAVSAATPSVTTRSHNRSTTAVTVGASVNLSKYQDNADDNFDDLGDIGGAPGNSHAQEIVNTKSRKSQQQSDSGGSRQAVRRKSKEIPNSAIENNVSLQSRLKLTTLEPEADAFDEFLNYKFEENDFAQDSAKDVHIKRSRAILQLMEGIKPDSAEQDVVEKCNSLFVMFDSYPEQREHLITHYGVLPILDMLEARSGLRPNIPVLDMLEARSGNVRPHVLQVINKIVEGSRKAQEQLSLVGLIPIVMRLLEHSVDPKIHSKSNKNVVAEEVDPVVLEAARFVHQISSTSSLTLQMLIGAGGLPVLVHMVAFCYQMQSTSHLTSLTPPIISTTISRSMKATEDARIMVYMGVDCITQVFSVQSSRTRDFCRLFIKLGLLPHLTVAFRYVMGLASSKPNNKQALTSDKNIADTIQDAYFTSSGTDAIAYEVEETLQCKYASRIATIFWNFSRYEVADQMGHDGVLDVIIAALKCAGEIDPAGKFRNLYDKRTKLSSSYVDIVELLLKCIKNMSMEPAALVELENCGAIGALIPLLTSPLRDRCLNHVLPCMYNLCRINKRRQEQAAVQGLIPHLQRLITEESHLRQFALPIICDMAHASTATRAELWSSNGLVFFINLLHEKYWQTFALNSLAVWLANDARAELILVEPSNLTKLIEFFRAASTQTINTIHKPLVDMMSKSRGLCRGLGCSGLFVSALVKRLKTSEAIVLRSLLKMLQFIHQHHPYPRQLVLDHNLYSIVKSLAQEEGQVLVNQMANRLLRDFQTSTLS